MSEERRPLAEGAPEAITTIRLRGHASTAGLAARAMSVQSTGLQVAQFQVARLILGLREEVSPRESAVLFDTHRRWLERECERQQTAIRRWAA
jgi:hypothetical protein